MYEKIVEKFKKIKEDKEVDIDDGISILQQVDKDYLETNNYAYNQHQNTQSNLITLGKYGERVPYLQMDAGKKDPKTVGKNIGKGIFNAWLFGRNNIAAPIDRTIGRFVVAPVHKILYNSEKNSGSVYNGIMSHRYTARKDYFTHKYLKQIDDENKKREEQGLEPIKPSIMKLAFGVRLEAINKYKEGNIAVLSAGAKDIEKSVLEHKKSEILKKVKGEALSKTRQKMLEKIQRIKDEMSKTKDEDERLELEALLQHGTSNLLIIEDEISKNEEIKVDSIIQTDAVSMEQHDKANKANITRAISGVKMVARMAAMHFIGKNISKYIAEKTTEQKWVPEHVVEQEQWVPGKVEQTDLSNITVRDLVDATNNGTVSYDSIGGNIVGKPNSSFIRGIAINNAEGRTISGSDAIGFSIAGRTDTQIDAITQDASIFEVVAETMTKAGKPVTSNELMDQILSSSNPQKALEDALMGTRIWVSSSDKGIPTGWLDVSDGVKNISTEVTKGHMETVEQIVPGYFETVISTGMKKVIDGRMAAVEGMLAAGGARDLYELARRTKGQEEMKKEGTTKQQAEPFQKNNKPEQREYENNKYGFTGTQKGDRASTYDENDIER